MLGISIMWKKSTNFNHFIMIYVFSMRKYWWNTIFFNVISLIICHLLDNSNFLFKKFFKISKIHLIYYKHYENNANLNKSPVCFRFAFLQIKFSVHVYIWDILNEKKKFKRNQNEIFNLKYVSITFWAKIDKTNFK